VIRDAEDWAAVILPALLDSTGISDFNFVSAQKMYTAALSYLKRQSPWPQLGGDGASLSPFCGALRKYAEWVIRPIWSDKRPSPAGILPNAAIANGKATSQAESLKPSVTSCPAVVCSVTSVYILL
jgi:hypothetical protein